jgi:hypothetical protein
MLPAGLRLAHNKQVAIARCDGEIMQAATALERILDEARPDEIGADEAEDLGPLAIQVVELRRRRRRLEKELRAIAAEWQTVE